MSNRMRRVAQDLRHGCRPSATSWGSAAESGRKCPRRRRGAVEPPGPFTTEPVSPRGRVAERARIKAMARAALRSDRVAIQRTLINSEPPAID